MLYLRSVNYFVRLSLSINQESFKIEKNMFGKPHKKTTRNLRFVLFWYRNSKLNLIVYCNYSSRTAKMMIEQHDLNSEDIIDEINEYC